MLYRNTRTGAVIETNAQISGENWKAVETQEPKEKKKQPKANKEKNG